MNEENRPIGFRRLYVAIPATIWFRVQERRAEYNSRNALVVDLIRKGLEK